MSSHDQNRASLVERRAQRVANARSVTLGLAASFLGLAFCGAILMRLADPTNFPSLGLAFWWALQTVTTVGYGDVVPHSTEGRVIGGVEMVIGISLISLLTAAVTSTVIERTEAATREQEHLDAARQHQAVLDAFAHLDARLNRIESSIGR